jgi:uncharacterized protein (TIRG00374 family)
LLHFLPFATLRAALSKVPPLHFATILIFYLCAHTVGIAKWRMMVNSAGSQLDFSTSAQCYLGGLFGTLFLPSIIGGDVVRMAVGLQRSPRPAAVLAGNVVDRFLDVLAQATLVAIGLVLLPGSLPAQFRALGLRVLIAVALVFTLVSLAVVVLGRMILGGRSRRFLRRVARLRHALHCVRRSPQAIILGWVLGVLIQSSFIFSNAMLAVSLGLDLHIRVWIFAWPLAKLAALLPLTQGGMGVREAALVALLLPFGAPSALVLAAGLVWEGIIISGGLVSGLLAYALRRATPASKR